MCLELCALTLLRRKKPITRPYLAKSVIKTCKLHLAFKTMTLEMKEA